MTSHLHLINAICWLRRAALWQRLYRSEQAARRRATVSTSDADHQHHCSRMEQFARLRRAIESQ